VAWLAMTEALKLGTDTSPKHVILQKIVERVNAVTGSSTKFGAELQNAKDDYFRVSSGAKKTLIAASATKTWSRRMPAVLISDIQPWIVVCRRGMLRIPYGLTWSPPPPEPSNCVTKDITHIKSTICRGQQSSLFNRRPLSGRRPRRSSTL